MHCSRHRRGVADDQRHLPIGDRAARDGPALSSELLSLARDVARVAGTELAPFAERPGQTRGFLGCLRADDAGIAARFLDLLDDLRLRLDLLGLARRLSSRRTLLRDVTLLRRDLAADDRVRRRRREN